MSRAGQQKSGSSLGAAAQQGGRAHVLIMTILFIGAAIVGVFLLPGENERVAMLERDGHNREALLLLETSFKQGNRRQRSLYQMQSLYDHFGELSKSRSTLEMLAKERPGDAYVQRQLAHFYKATQDHEAYVATLRKQLSIRYSEPACRELIGILRRQGKFEVEQRMIEKCASDGYRRTEDLVRLAYLAAADQSFQMTAELLSSIDDRRKLEAEKDRLMLFEALLLTDRPREARKRGVRWLQDTPDDGLALSLISRLTREQRYVLAIKLARDVSSPGDTISLSVAELMLEQDQAVAAKYYLRGWLDKTNFSSPGLVSRFIQSALDADDIELALAASAKYGMARLAQADLVNLAIATGAAGRSDDFKTIISRIETLTLETRPLLNAGVAQSVGRTREAVKLLKKVKKSESDRWRQEFKRWVRKNVAKALRAQRRKKRRGRR